MPERLSLLHSYALFNTYWALNPNNKLSMFLTGYQFRVKLINVNYLKEKTLMPGSSLFTLIDDIASVLDDVAVLTKVATKKTSGVLGDDLALNAQQVTGISADREIPVVLAVAKGSAVNKLILVPIALLLSAFLPKLIPVLLIFGGLFLCYEGSEKVLHYFQKDNKSEEAHHKEHLEHLKLSDEELLNFEKDKVKGAIRTDFVLSAEIINITLGTVSQSSIGVQVAVLTGISAIMTFGVYGLVAGIVKLDDFALYLLKSSENQAATMKNKIGKFLLWMMPYFMKGLSIGGTLAMFLVGGGILTHSIPMIHHWTEPMGAWSFLLDGGLGFISGLICIPIVAGVKRLIPKKSS